MFIAFTLVSTVFVYALSPNMFKLRQEERTLQSMREAKEALIAYAATHSTLPGRLPCPEDPNFIGKPNEGNQQSSCSNALPVTGRLPWRSLGLNNPANTGEALWYVRSPGFANTPINSNSLGKLQLDGISDIAVALVIAPGPALPGQSRSTPSPSNPPDPDNYLDLGNATGPAYQSSGSVETFNDRVLAISVKELFHSVEIRVVKEARSALENYYTSNGYFPKPAQFSDTNCLGSGEILSLCNNDLTTCSTSVCRGRIPANPIAPAVPWPIDPPSILRGTTGSLPNWFQKNGWRELILYAVSPACAEATCTIGSLTVLNNNSSILGQKAILVLAGNKYATQSRSSNAEQTTLSNYFEDENISPPDNVFTTQAIFLGGNFNDRLAW